MEAKPAWTPTAQLIESANISQFMRRLGMSNLAAFRQWSVTHYQEFWPAIIRQLGIVFKVPFHDLFDYDPEAHLARWLVGAKLNIVDSCFTAPPSYTAIIYEDDQQIIHRLSYGELDQLTNQVANSLLAHGFSAGDAIAIAMPMNIQAIVSYLGVIKMGGIVVSIADSFSSSEMATRLTIGQAKAVFTQDHIQWGNKKHPLYEKLRAAEAPPCIVLMAHDHDKLVLRQGDITWDQFLVKDSVFQSHACEAMTPCHILFSSGTTGDPKAIPWNHTTPIKVASDAYFHQNIQPQDVLTWPTSLGWMMGPWLVFAALINHATIALYGGSPTNRKFGAFIQHANVTMLGVVPSMVATWRQSKCMEGLDWHKIKVFSSTGECSNADDMRYLMTLGGNKPVIEYCGGTEIGGAYLSSTVIEDNYPAQFTGPTIGADFSIYDERGLTTHYGEVAIHPMSIGLSTCLLNGDHQKIYFSGMPLKQGVQLRRHGDLIERLSNGNFAILGRTDDTMNLNGIKTSAAEIERSIAGIPDIIESAAIAVPLEKSGPNQLFIFSVSNIALDKQSILKEMQNRIGKNLNPLFKITDVIFIDALPKTASNKIMRRQLRKSLIELHHSPK